MADMMGLESVKDRAVRPGVGVARWRVGVASDATQPMVGGAVCQVRGGQLLGEGGLAAWRDRMR